MVCFLAIVRAVRFSCTTVFLLLTAASVGLIFEYFFLGATCFLGYHLSEYKWQWLPSLKHGVNICDKVMFQNRPLYNEAQHLYQASFGVGVGVTQLLGKSISSCFFALGKFLEARLGEGCCHRTLPDPCGCSFIQLSS